MLVILDTEHRGRGFLFHILRYRINTQRDIACSSYYHRKVLTLKASNMSTLSHERGSTSPTIKRGDFTNAMIILSYTKAIPLMQLEFETFIMWQHDPVLILSSNLKLGNLFLDDVDRTLYENIRVVVTCSIHCSRINT